VKPKDHHPTKINVGKKKEKTKISFKSSPPHFFVVKKIYQKMVTKPTS